MLWQLIADNLERAPELIQTGVAIAVGSIIIMVPIVIGVLCIVVFVKDVSAFGIQVSSKKRRNRRASDRKK